MGAGSGTINAIQHFDTFLGTGEGHIDSTIDTYNGTVLGQCNILDKPGLLEFYLGAYTGFSVSTSTIVPIYYYYPYYESTTNEIQKVNPIIGGEAGFNIYLMKMIKISMLMGSYYAGEMEYSAKKYTYWGEAKYEREKLKLHPFYIGFAVTISLWPALM
jgi:hypothetical protein